MSANLTKRDSGAASGRGRSHRVVKTVLLVGFLAFVIAVYEAYTNPARSYELDILAATPLAFWAGIGVAFLAGMVVSLEDVSGWVRSGALMLMSLAALAVAGLPIIRGFFFYGGGDALSHLGFAKAFVSGADSPLNLLHPGIHLVSIILGAASNAPLEWAFKVMVIVFFLAFLVFVPVTVRAITGNTMGLVVGTFAAVLFLPINNISVHPSPHPTSQAILFLPFILYLLVNYLSSKPVGRNITAVSSVGVLLALSSVAVLFLHPQQALNVILVFGTVIGLQLLVRLFRPAHRFASHHALYAQTAFLSVLFVIWAPRSERTTDTVDALTNALLHGADVGDDIAVRGSSLSVLGGSLEELFIKLVFAAFVFAIIAGIFIFLSLTGRYDGDLPERNSFVKYFGLALGPIFGVVLVYFVASATTQHFRHIGFMMAIATIIGAVALTYGAGEVRNRLSWGTVQLALILLFAILFPLTMAALHPSPYYYQDSSQVTEAQMNGYQTAFDVRDEDIPWAGIRGGPRRFVEALIYGTNTTASEEFPGLKEDIPEGVFSNGTLTTYYADGRYLAITNRAIERETGLYQGFRYSDEEFAALESTPGIDRVSTNNEFDLYLIRGPTSPEPASRIVSRRLAPPLSV
jgi:hypothetical protein